VPNYKRLFWNTCAALGKDPALYNVWLTFMLPDEIRELNARTRGIDKATDVLSYPVDLSYSTDIIELGDIILCPRVARRMKIPLDFLYVHGLLHLFGFDHQNDEDQEKMNALTEDILGKGDVNE
jgi:probable rRNA maturation factor